MSVTLDVVRGLVRGLGREIIVRTLGKRTGMCFLNSKVIEQEVEQHNHECETKGNAS